MFPSSRLVPPPRRSFEVGTARSHLLRTNPGPLAAPPDPRSLEPLWSQEVEQVEQLLQVVLKRGPCQQQLVINLVAVQDPEELRGGEGPSGARRQPRRGGSAGQTAYLGLVVFQPVGLVHHEAGPLDGAQDGLVDGDELVGGEQDVEFDLHFFLEGRGTCGGRAGRQVGQGLQRQR